MLFFYVYLFTFHRLRDSDEAGDRGIEELSCSASNLYVMALVSGASLEARHTPGKTLCSSHSRTQAENHELNQKEEKFRKQPSL